VAGSGGGALLPQCSHLKRTGRGGQDAAPAAARDHAGCRELLDLDSIDAALCDWPDPVRARAQWDRTTQVYRYNLLRALLMCRYLRFFDTHASKDTAR
jgi:hypothetical protein